MIIRWTGGTGNGDKRRTDDGWTEKSRQSATDPRPPPPAPGGPGNVREGIQVMPWPPITPKAAVSLDHMVWNNSLIPSLIFHLLFIFKKAKTTICLTNAKRAKGQRWKCQG